jgi:hypothetical protein
MLKAIGKEEMKGDLEKKLKFIQQLKLLLVYWSLISSSSTGMFFLIFLLSQKL